MRDSLIFKGDFLELNYLNIIIAVAFTVIESIFAISSIALLYPLIFFIQNGKEEFSSLLESNQYLDIIFSQLSFDITLINLILLVVLPLLFQQSIAFVRQIIIIDLQTKTTVNVRSKIVNSIFFTSKSFFVRTKLGDIANTLSMEMFRVGLMLNNYINMISNVFICFIYIIFLMFISVKLTIFSLILLLPIPLVTKKMATLMKQNGKQSTKVYTASSVFLLERLRNITKTKLLNMEVVESGQYCRIAYEGDLLLKKRTFYNAMLTVIFEPALMLVMFVILFFSIEFFKLEFSALMVFIYALYKLNSPLRSVLLLNNQVNIYKASYDKIYNMFKLAQKTQCKSDGYSKFSNLNKSIFLKNIDLKLGDKYLFKKLNLKINAFSTTAIIGKSGAGKSTLIDLILKIKEVTSGNVFFDTLNINDIKISSLYNKVGYISQEPMLFQGTILENITYGLSSRTKDEIKYACKKAHLSDFIKSLDDGLSTDIGEGGNKLSGGEKQRLQLAHLFLQDPDIIIMDEPTSALDGESEKVIVDSLKELHGKKTIIIIAHRLSTIRHADKIVVLEDGKIIEEGPHQKLLKNAGRYKKYFDSSNA